MPRAISQRKSYKKKVMRVCEAFEDWTNCPPSSQAEIHFLERLSLSAYRAMKYLKQRLEHGE